MEAFPSVTSCRLLALVSFAILLPSSAFDFIVGGKDAAGMWAIPPDSEPEFYNKWAARNRFQVGYVLYFRYSRDSVLEVSEADYRSCAGLRPLLYADGGVTRIELHRPGLFFFISGANGHCVRGQKMIVKVLDPHPFGNSSSASFSPSPASSSSKLAPTPTVDLTTAASSSGPASISLDVRAAAVTLVLAMLAILLVV